MRKEKELLLDMTILARMALSELTEDEIQEWYGSDYFNDLKEYIKEQGRRVHEEEKRKINKKKVINYAAFGWKIYKTLKKRA
ncbi:hypothetical protein [Peribacillus frigoritolerans]|uniref:hypothetical protein n=1 Tax=Peribacillus frigoritolerans TaxID=450367 RepID=UPI0030159F9F